MTKRELLERYRALVVEVNLLEKQSAFLNKYIGGPQPIRSARLTGMPRGTNNPEAAILQQVDNDDAIYEVEKKSAELRELLNEFNIIVESIDDDDDRNIIRSYYALGWKDREIAEALNYDKSTIWRRRTRVVNNLDRI